MTTKLFPNCLTTSLATDARVGLPIQEALPFAPRIAQEPVFLPSRSQEEAGELILRHVGAMDRGGGLTTLLLIGPRGSGKSRLLRELMLAETDLQLTVLDVDELRPLEAFAAINRAATSRRVLVLEGRTRAAHWFADTAATVPPDLVSRLSAAPQVSLDRPSAESLLVALRADIDLHGLRLSEEELAALAHELPRDFAAPRRFCRALDRVAGKQARRERLQWAVEQAHVPLHGTKPEGGPDS